MKVIISCGGKFHAFNLAEQLDRRGYLHEFFTTYYSQKNRLLPKFRRDKEQINTSKVITNIIPEIVSKSFNKILKIKDWDYYSHQMFDYWVSYQIDRCDIVVAWSSYALQTFRKAKTYSAMTILERGSSHILFQKEILEEEYAKYGLKIKPIDDRIVEKELAEYREADYISIPSSYVKQTFIDKGVSKEKLIHVPYGVDLSYFKQIPKNDDIFRVVFVGGLTLRKGVHYLLEAFSSLKLQNAELLLIGSISSEIKPFLKKHEGFYKYVGKVPHSDLYKFMSQGSVFILPSIEEGLAMVIPQAMACGLPVICTTNTGGSDIVRDKVDGYIIPVRNIEAIKEKLLYLYENQDICKGMGNSALSRVKNGFTWNDYGEKIIECYSKLLKNRQKIFLNH